ncbi:MAG TPA: Pr6Pr family membrane protein [Solirubrobacteraceae bacterium]
MSPRWGRVWFGATAACVLAGVTISVFTAANNSGGHFHPAAARAVNTLAFFTIQSNVLVGLATLLLAVRLDRASTAFSVLRLAGLVAITVTGLVFHAVLAQTLDLRSWDAVGNELVHTVVPVMAVVGWLLLGPRRLVSARVAWLSLIFPICWLAFTLIRGAIAHWYPYPFIDVTALGYGRAAVNCVWVALLMLGLAAGATVLDGRLAHPAHAVR